MADREPLTSGAVVALAAIVEAARNGSRVRRMTPSGDVVDGVARHLVVSAERPVFLGAGDDIRDACLWVSGVFEHFWPVAELVDEYDTGMVVFR